MAQVVQGQATRVIVVNANDRTVICTKLFGQPSWLSNRMMIIVLITFQQVVVYIIFNLYNGSGIIIIVQTIYSLIKKK